MSAAGGSLSRPGVDALAGEWRRPHNDLQQQEVGGGHKAIHDDATAAEAGFAAAPIHGTVHWSQFTPLLLQAFGPAWFETGSISVHFANIVGHLQPVRAFVGRPVAGKAAQQVDIWMEHMDGRVVLEGTAGVGLKPGEATTMVQSKIAGIKPVKGNLVLVRHPVGTTSLNEETAKIEHDSRIGPLFPFTLKKKLEIITEFHPWFTKEGGSKSPWGRAVLPPESLNQIMLGMCGTKVGARWPAVEADRWLHQAMAGRTPVGFFGGCEVIIHSGPVFVDEEYKITRELVGKGEISKAEFRWMRTLLRDRSGKLVAEMTLQDMMLKSSVKGYKELRARSDAGGAEAKL
mmetsp:Transcript_19286/g.54483  ORF Transcript_19286/g.54483 Transcript_19286/m.54483 type:complete len:345 (+) Transcript_19286:65-1099(+)